MNSTLLSAALTVIPVPQTLVNVVRLRVKQLAAGHRPLVFALPGAGFADVALTEIAEGKLSFEPTEGADPLPELEAKLVSFPGRPRTKRAAA
jgi:hypothetical protein